MIKKNIVIYCACIFSSSAFAIANTEQIDATQLAQTYPVAMNNTVRPSGRGLPDNPSLWRVLLYKTGQGIRNTGNAIEQSATKASQGIAHSSQSLTNDSTGAQAPVAQAPVAPAIQPIAAQPIPINNPTAVPIEQKSLTDLAQP